VTTKSKVASEMEAAAERQRRPGESSGAAYVRFCASEEANQMYARYLEAVDDEPAARRFDEPVAEMGALESAAWDRIENAARRFTESGAAPTRERAIAKALQDDPSLYVAYERAREADAYADTHPEALRVTSEPFRANEPQSLRFSEDAPAPKRRAVAVSVSNRGLARAIRTLAAERPDLAGPELVRRAAEMFA